MANEKQGKNIGIVGVDIPKDGCDDVNCPFHGSLGIRGRTFAAKVVSAKASKSVVVSWDRRIFVPKYERFEKRRSKVSAHLPPCVRVNKEDIVLVGECKPISKTKRFVVLKVVGDSK